MRSLFFGAILFSGYGCASAPLSRGPLVDLVLRPRPGFEGRLTNQTCETYKGPDCIGRDVLELDLRLKEVRDRLIAAKFICSVNKVRYRVCSELQGLCHQTLKRGWFNDKVILLDHINIVSGYQRLLDANTFCAAQESDLGREMFDPKDLD